MTRTTRNGTRARAPSLEPVDAGGAGTGGVGAGGVAVSSACANGANRARESTLATRRMGPGTCNPRSGAAAGAPRRPSQPRALPVSETAGVLPRYRSGRARRRTAACQRCGDPFTRERAVPTQPDPADLRRERTAADRARSGPAALGLLGFLGVE